MNDFISTIIDKVRSQGNKIVDNSLLSDKSWFLISKENLNEKIVFIFRTNGTLLISKNGDIVKATWEVINHSTNSIMIEQTNSMTLFNILLLSGEYLLLQKDGTKNYDLFVKQERYNLLKESKDLLLDSAILDDIKLYLNNRNLINTKSIIKTNSLYLDSTGANRNDFSYNTNHQETRFIEDERRNQTPKNDKFLKEPITWYIQNDIRNNLQTVELMGLSKYQDKIKLGDYIIKSLKSQIISLVSENEWEVIDDKINYIVLIDTKKI